MMIIHDQHHDHWIHTNNNNNCNKTHIEKYNRQLESMGLMEVQKSNTQYTMWYESM